MSHLSFRVLHRVQAWPRGSLFGEALTALVPLLAGLGAVSCPTFVPSSAPLISSDSRDESEIAGDEGGTAILLSLALSKFVPAVPSSSGESGGGEE